MRLLTVALVACTLLVIAPAEAGPGSGADCDIEEEYVTEARLGDLNNIDPEHLVEPGAPRPIECYY